MAQYGKIMEGEHAKAGRIFKGDLTLPDYDGQARLVPAAKRTDKSPDFIVEAPGPRGTPIQIGAAWTKQADETGLHYLSLTFQAPGRPTIYAAMFPEDDTGQDRKATNFDKGVPLLPGRVWNVTWTPPRARPMGGRERPADDLGGDGFDF